MKILVERTHLLAALKAVGQLADGKSAIPIIGCIRIKAAGGTLAIAATDLEAWAEAEIPAEIGEAGTVALPGPDFQRMVQNFPEGAQVSIDASQSPAIIKAGRSRWQLGTISADDFPDAYEAGPKAARFTLAPEEIIRLFDLPKAAASKGNVAQGYLEGILLHGPLPKGLREMRGVAANGHVLLAAHIDLPEGGDDLPLTPAEWPSIMVPLGAAAHLVRLGKAGLDVEAGPNVLTVRGGGAMKVRFSTKLLENRFPLYTRFLPELAGAHIEVEGGAFAAAIGRLAAMAGEVDRGIAIEWDETGDLQLWLDDAASNVSGVETVEIESRQGAARIGLRSGYVMSAVAAVGHGRLEIWSPSPDKSVRFRNVDDPELIACIAPQHLKRRA